MDSLCGTTLRGARDDSTRSAVALRLGSTFRTHRHPPLTGGLHMQSGCRAVGAPLPMATALQYSQHPAAHRHSSALLGRRDEIGAAIRRLPVTYDEWQIVYRQALQLGRSLRGEPQLLEQGTRRNGSLEENMDRYSAAETAAMTPPMMARARRAEAFSTRQLLGEISDKASLLIKKEVELVRNEIKADLRSQLAMAKGFAAAVIVTLMALTMLPLALVFALVSVMPAWVAALAVAGGLLVIAAIVAYVSWQRRVTTPLALTRKTLKEDVQWAKERLP